MKIIAAPSPNFNDRPEGTAIDTLVLHYTGMQSAHEALVRMQNPDAQPGPVSAHYMIDEDGTIFALVEDEKRAWHAGVSFWRGRTGLNDGAIGIEIVNPGHEFGYRPFPDIQMEALAELARAILARHPAITPDRVLAHSDIAPTRKSDPGEKFDWRRLADQGIGLWPSPGAEDEEKARLWLAQNGQADLQQALTDWGYDPAAPASARACAFNRHFAGSAAQTLSLEAASMLANLTRSFL